MRIAIVAAPNVPVPPVKYGGTEQVIYYLVKGLKEAGHEPILLASGDSTVDCELIPIADKAIFFAKHKTDIEAHKQREEAIWKVTDQKLRELLPSIDVIHSHGYDLSAFRNFPNVTTLHGMIKFEQLAMLDKELFYVSISENQQSAYPDLKYIDTIYNGEDPAAFPIVTEPEDYVCFLGRFDRDKNPHSAIELAINLGLKIKVAGKIDYKGEGYFEEEVAKYFDHPLVEYLGEVTFEEKVELLSKAKCNLHPTNFREPFGLTVLEAAYCGTPTLATARGSMPELIEAGRTGVLVEDFIEGRQHLEECFAMDRHYIATRARELFNYQTMANRYVQAYQYAIDHTARPKPPLYRRLLQRLGLSKNRPAAAN